MVDYLEKVWEHADALLEQMRRMERGLFGPNGEGGRTSAEVQGRSKHVSGEEEMVYSEGNLVNYTENMVYNPEIPEETPVEKAKQIVNRQEKIEDKPGIDRQTVERTEDGGERRENAPLAAQLERLERAVTLTDGPVFRQKSGSGAEEESSDRMGRGPASGLEPEEAEKARMGGIGGLSSPGREEDWVEQADRAFCRDSRRYDGGFYLY